MVNLEIFEGLKSALGKGENLELAMITFYNAGYKKEEIEEAAKALQIQKFKQIQPTQPVQPPSAQPILTQPPQIQPTPIKQTMPEKQPVKQIQKPPIQSSRKPIIKKPVKIIQKVSSYKQPVKRPIIRKPIQKVSSYRQPEKKPRGIFVPLILIFTLLLLLGSLAGVFFFKEELIEFLNNLFG